MRLRPRSLPSPAGSAGSEAASRSSPSSASSPPAAAGVSGCDARSAAAAPATDAARDRDERRHVTGRPGTWDPGVRDDGRGVRDPRRGGADGDRVVHDRGRLRVHPGGRGDDPGAQKAVAQRAWDDPGGVQEAVGLRRHHALRQPGQGDRARARRTSPTSRVSRRPTRRRTSARSGATTRTNFHLGLRRGGLLGYRWVHPARRSSRSSPRRS